MIPAFGITQALSLGACPSLASFLPDVCSSVRKITGPCGPCGMSWHEKIDLERGHLEGVNQKLKASAFRRGVWCFEGLCHLTRCLED